MYPHTRNDISCTKCHHMLHHAASPRYIKDPTNVMKEAAEHPSFNEALNCGEAIDIFLSGHLRL